MSTFGEEVFPWDGTFNASSESFSNPVIINCAYPALILQGTESGGGTVAIYEAGGSLYLATNATWNGSAWIPVNTSLAPTLLGIGNNTHVLGYWTGVAGTNPVVFTSTYSATSPGYMTIFGNIKLQWGTGTVASDNSSLTTVTFPSAYTSACWGVVASVVSNVAQVVTLQPQPSPSTTAFEIAGLGGSTSANVNFFWVSIGI